MIIGGIEYSEREVKAMKKALAEHDYYPEDEAEFEHLIDINLVTLNEGRDGRKYAWVLTESDNIIVDVETLELSKDQKKIEKLFC